MYIHYNGWPTRWDEWIPVDSPRLAPFRTRTIHSVLQMHLSPEPAAWLPNAPTTGSDEFEDVLSQVCFYLPLHFK